jgi:7-cyano-7-deazaguanine synthase
MERAAVVSLSGGLDSATVAWLARSSGYKLYTLSVDYGQTHKAELKAAARLAERLQATHHVIQMDLRPLCASALTGRKVELPEGSNIPVTYVPSRNMILLSLCVGLAESVGAWDIYYGANAVDYSGYPDCRPQFVTAFESAMNLGTRAGVEGRRFTLHAPIINRTKADIVLLGAKLGVPFELTHSCYFPHESLDGETFACGGCDSCRIRLAAFKKAGLEDPVAYVARHPEEDDPR